jgi:hypothetical protein
MQAALFRYKPGFPEDGVHCEHDHALTALIETKSVSITLRKPGLHESAFTLTARAIGEAPLHVTFELTFERLDHAHDRIGFLSGVALERPSVSGFGLHIEFPSPLAASWDAQLDWQKLVFAQSRQYPFFVSLACPSNGNECAADGDVINATIVLTGNGILSESVTVLTSVVAIASCDQSWASMRFADDFLS